MKPFLTIGLTILLTALRCLGQVNDYTFSKLDTRDGLSNNLINTIYKDRKGFLWFGTLSGVNRYDGYTCKIFLHNDKDSTSIKDDNVTSIFEGPLGKLWMHSYGGISIYDPATERFDPHPERFFHEKHLPYDTHLPFGGLVRVLQWKEDYYIVYADSGIFRWNSHGAPVCIKPAINGPKAAGSSIVASKMDSIGHLWLVHADGFLEKFDAGRQTVLYSTPVLQKENEKNHFRFALYIDRQGILWLYCYGFLSGLYQYDPRTNALRHFSKDSGARPGNPAPPRTQPGPPSRPPASPGPLLLSSNAINDVTQDESGLIWIATDQGGVDLLDKQKGTVRYLLTSEEAGSLVQNSITSLYKDDLGIIWLGSYKKGINYFHPNLARFPLFRHQASQPNSLPYDDIDRFAEDKFGNLWIGTNGGGLIRYDRTGNTFTSYRHKPDDTNTPALDVIVGLRIDHEGKLWIGYYQGGLDCFDKGRFVHYRHDDADPNSLTDNRVICITEDADGHLWIGTMRGLDRLDPGRKDFYHFKKALDSIPAYISSIKEDVSGNMWIGTTSGVEVWQRSTGRFTHFSEENSKLSDHSVNDLWADPNGNMWVATKRGLNVLEKGSDTFRVFLAKDGLPDNVILNVLQDDEGHLWVSTPAGLSKIVISHSLGHITIACINYDEYDGLQGRGFNENAAFRTREGELLFGGPNGFNLFKPSRVGWEARVAPVVITGFKLFSKDMTSGVKWKGRTILEHSITETSQVQLAHNENDFTLEFAGLSYINAKKDKYAYRLEGYDKDWILVDGQNRKAVYVNIPPGEYNFRVKFSNRDGVWNEKDAAIKIIVKPSFWMTPAAWALYILVLATLLFAARLIIAGRARARLALHRERQEALRIHQLDSMKIKFLANVSDEFRAPLSMILTPVDKLTTPVYDPDSKNQFHHIERNAKRLLHLVNQLLDFRKMQADELKLNKTPGDIAAFIKDTAYSFIDLAGENNIDFTYRSDISRLMTLFDHDKIERVVFNLLSNAFKFTPEHGSVIVELANVRQDQRSVLLELTVKDTGIGIAPEMQQKIFEAFSRAPGNPSDGTSGHPPRPPLKPGSGIGLAITREFVEMHSGRIKVDSELNKGSIFSVLLPLELLPPEIRKGV